MRVIGVTAPAPAVFQERMDLVPWNLGTDLVDLPAVDGLVRPAADTMSNPGFPRCQPGSVAAAAAIVSTFRDGENMAFENRFAGDRHAALYDIAVSGKTEVIRAVPTPHFKCRGWRPVVVPPSGGWHFWLPPGTPTISEHQHHG